MVLNIIPDTLLYSEEISGIANTGQLDRKSVV